MSEVLQRVKIRLPPDFLHLSKMSAHTAVYHLLREHYKPGGKPFSGVAYSVRTKQNEEIVGVEGIYTKSNEKGKQVYRFVMLTREGNKVPRPLTEAQAQLLSDELDIEIEEDVPTEKAKPVRSSPAARAAAKARKNIPRACAVEVDEDCVYADSMAKGAAAVARRAAAGAGGSAAPAKKAGRPAKPKKAPGGQAGVKRGPSGWNLFVKENFKIYGDLISTGAAWKSMTEAEKGAWNARAKGGK